MNLQFEITEAHFALARQIKSESYRDLRYDECLISENFCPTSLAVMSATGLGMRDVCTDGVGRITLQNVYKSTALDRDHPIREVIRAFDSDEAYDHMLPVWVTVDFRS